MTINSAISSIDAPPPSYSEHPIVESDNSTAKAPAAAPMDENEYFVKRKMRVTTIDGAKNNSVQDVMGARDVGLQSYS